MLVSWIITAVLVCAGVAAFYYYHRWNDEVRQRVQTAMSRLYPNLAITIEGATLIQGEGVRIRDLSIMRPADMGLTKRGELAYADEVFLSCDTSMMKLLKGEVNIDHVRVRGLLIRATCEADGTWSLAQLLPLPKSSGTPPTVTIEEATIEVIDRRNNPPSVLMLQNIRLAAAPVDRPEVIGDIVMGDIGRFAQQATAVAVADAQRLRSSQTVVGAARENSASDVVAAGLDVEIDVPEIESIDTPGSNHLPSKPRLTSSSPVEASGKPKWLQVTGVLSSEHFRRAEFRAFIDPSNGSWYIDGNLTALRMAPELARALPVEIASPFQGWEGLRATSNLSFTASSSVRPQTREFRTDASRSGSPIRFVVDGQVTDGRFEDPRLPQTLTDLRVENFHCENAGGTVRNVTGRLGDAAIQASLASDGWSPPADWTVAASVSNFNITRELVELLPQDQQTLWYRYQPLGRVNAAFKLARRQGAWTGSGAVQCEDISLLCEKFPYPVQRVSGSVTFDENRRLAVDVWGIANRTPVRVFVDVQNPGPDFQGQFQVTSNGPVAVDETLLTALPTEVRNVVVSMHPHGEVAVDAHFERSLRTHGVLSRHITVKLSNGNVRYGPFPYPLQDVQGTVVVEDERTEFRNLQGKNDSCLVKCDGELVHVTNQAGRQLSLRFVATDVPCEDELRDALPAGPRRLWQGLRPRGSIDRLELEVAHVTGQERPDISIVLNQLVHEQSPEQRSLMLQPTWFPYRMEDVTGTLVYHRDGRFELQNIRASHDSVRLDSRGEGYFDDDGNWRVRIDRVMAERVLVDRELLQALPGELGETLAQMRFVGSLRIGGHLDFLGTSDPEIPVNAAWDLQVNVDDGRLSVMGHNAEHVYGALRVVGRRTDQLVRNSGLVNIDSVMYRGVQLRYIQGPWWLDDQKLVFGQHAPEDRVMPATTDLMPAATPARIRANVFGSVVEAEGAVALVENGPFQVSCLATGADMRVLAQELLLPHEINGRADASLEVSGSKRGVFTWQGRGSVRLRQANIYRLPAIISLLNEMRITQEDPSAFTASDISFRVQGDHLYFDQFDLHGESLTLKGQGEMGFDRHMLLDFYTILGGENRWLPFMRSVVGQASRQFLLIRVSGTLDNMRMDREVLPGLNERLQILFPELTPLPSSGLPPANGPVNPTAAGAAGGTPRANDNWGLVPVPYGAAVRRPVRDADYEGFPPRR